MFDNRRDAGRALAKQLQAEDLDDAVVLALPRGGVPVAAEICHALHLPLDLMLVRKIGVPGYRELALGAIAEGGELLVNHGVAESAGLSARQIEELAADEELELQRRRKRYIGQRQRVALRGRVVVLVDDGMATGATMRVAVRAARRSGAAKVLVAVPVAGQFAIDQLTSEADRVICLAVPSEFRSVGEHYRSFEQLTDAEVVDALGEVSRTAPASS